MEHKSNSNTNLSRSTWYKPKESRKETGVISKGLRLSRFRHCQGWVEYWEGSWRTKETCFLLESSEGYQLTPVLMFGGVLCLLAK